MENAVPDDEVWPVYIGKFNSTETDEAKIKGGIATPCRICEGIFRRVRLTWRYCAHCHKGFCEGEHGNFARGGVGCCIQCGPHA